MSAEAIRDFVIGVLIIGIVLLVGIFVMDAIVVYGPQSPSDPLSDPQQAIIQAFTEFAPMIIPGALAVTVIVIAYLKQ
jgi:hypothetical protein